MFIDVFFLRQELEFTETLKELAIKVNIAAFLVYTHHIRHTRSAIGLQ